MTSHMDSNSETRAYKDQSISLDIRPAEPTRPNVRHTLHSRRTRLPRRSDRNWLAGKRATAWCFCRLLMSRHYRVLAVESIRGDYSRVGGFACISGTVEILPLVVFGNQWTSTGNGSPPRRWRTVIFAFAVWLRPKSQWPHRPRRNRKAYREVDRWWTLRYDTQGSCIPKKLVAARPKILLSCDILAVLSGCELPLVVDRISGSFSISRVKDMEIMLSEDGICAACFSKNFLSCNPRYLHLSSSNYNYSSSNGQYPKCW